MRRFLLLFIGVVVFIQLAVIVHADELDDINKQLGDLKKSLEASKQATAVNEQNLAQINAKLDGIKAHVAALEADIAKKEKDIAAGEKEISAQKKILDERVSVHYINLSKTSDSLIDILLTENLSKSMEEFFYQKSVLDENQKNIVRMVMRVKEIEDKKKHLEEEKEKMIPIKEEIAKQSASLASEVAKAKKFESEVQSKIAQLDARQKQIIAQKLSSLNIPRSAGTSTRGCSSDLTNGKDPGFSPKFGFFTYGAPHRNGLNQYGAWGRAKAGQNEEQILQEYYPGMSLKKDYDQNVQVNVEGHGTFTIEDYVKRIYEVPDSWADNNLAVLKAQAVAARTYALNTVQRRGSICTTEACQVFKPEPKGGNWEQAVNATAGWVLMDGGNPGFTQYASTHGGYIINLNKFDGSGGNPGSFAELNERAYDKDSPWFYCNWGSRPAYGGTAWLKPEEVADIANALLLAKTDSGTTSHLCQTDESKCADTWDANKVKEELRSRGQTPFNSVSDVSVDWDKGSGKTTGITIS